MNKGHALFGIFKRYASSIAKPVELSKIRNIGIIAHIDAGKTTTTERMLYYSGITKRIGNVDEGDTMTDYLTQERDRGITIQSAAVTIPWNNHRINIIDTPGHADFTFEVIRSLRVLDGAVTILDGVAGVEAQTEKVWKQATDLGIPKLVFVNKMDREGAGFGRTVKEVVTKLNTRAVLVNIPFFVEDPNTRQQLFKGIVDVFDKKLLKWKESAGAAGTGNLADGKEVEVTDIVEGHPLYDEVLRCREQAVETLGEFDDTVVDAFLECDEDYMEVPTKILKHSLRQATLKQFATPVLCGASFKNIAVQPLMDAVLEYLPSPLEMKLPEVKSIVRTNKKLKSKGKSSNVPSAGKINEDEVINLPTTIHQTKGCIINNNNNLTTALAFKVVTDPNRGILVFVRVYSGKLQSNSHVVNSKTGENVRIGKLLLMMADQPQEVSALTCGNIGVITGTNGEITTGDTLLTSGGKTVSSTEQFAKLNPIVIPPAVFSVSLEPKTVGDTRKMDESLEILLREDPSLKTHIDEESGQTILTGMGELHLDIAADRLRNDLKAKVQVGEVMVTYKENYLKDVTQPFTKEVDTGKGAYSITISLESFEGDVQDHIQNHNGTQVHLLNDNNAIVFEANSDPVFIQKELENEIWSLPVPYLRIIGSIVSGLAASLSISGPIAKLPFHSTVIKVHQYNLPNELDNVKDLLLCSRLCLVELIKSIPLQEFTFLEPIMSIQVFVNESDLGSVSQDLMTARKAIIHAIEDGNSLIDDNNAANNNDNSMVFQKIAQQMYLPKDITMEFYNDSISQKKLIKAEAPLKEMVGYLTKLRSLTKGTGNYDMSYLGMKRVDKERLNKILDS